LTSRGWVDPVPDPLLLRKSGSAGDRTRDFCICSQKLWPLDHSGGHQVNTGSKHGRCLRPTTYHLHVPMLRNLGALTSWNPVGLFRPVIGQLYHYLFINVKKASEVYKISKNPFKNMSIHLWNILFFSHLFVFMKISCYSITKVMLFSQTVSSSNIYM
jgi:hypothetical protein